LGGGGERKGTWGKGRRKISNSTTEGEREAEGGKGAEGKRATVFVASCSLALWKKKRKKKKEK